MNRRGAQPRRHVIDQVGHPLPLGSFPTLGGIETRVRRRNAQAVRLRALRQIGLGGIARSDAGVRDRGGGVARFGAARVRETGERKSVVGSMSHGV